MPTTVEPYVTWAAATAAPELRRWYGSALEEHLRAELAALVAERRDPDWAARYRAGCTIPGSAASDYLLRELTVGGVRVLAGIHFYRLDPQHPFVGVSAQDGELDRDALSSAVGEAFSVFAPRRMRTFGGSAPPGGELDQVLVAGRVAELLARPAPPGLSAVRFRCATAEEAAHGYGEAYAALLAERPTLVGRLGPHGAAELEESARQELLWVVEIDGERAGVMAARTDRCQGLTGHVIVEELLTARWRGRGFGPALQRRLFEALPSDTVVFGTIDARNEPSLRTAARAGRVAVGAWWFDPLRG